MEFLNQLSAGARRGVFLPGIIHVRLLPDGNKRRGLTADEKSPGDKHRGLGVNSPASKAAQRLAGCTRSGRSATVDCSQAAKGITTGEINRANGKAALLEAAAGLISDHVPVWGTCSQIIVVACGSIICACKKTHSLTCDRRYINNSSISLGNHFGHNGFTTYECASQI